MRINHFLRACVTLLCVTFSSLSHAEDAAASFQRCNSESFRALNMSRNYLLLTKREKSAVLRYIPPDDTVGQSLADELFTGVDAGKIVGYPDFAADHLLACAGPERLGGNSRRDALRACFAQSDNSFFLMAFKSQGMDRTTALEKLESMFKDQQLYPLAVIEFSADRVWESADGSADSLIKKFFWNCAFTRH